LIGRIVPVWDMEMCGHCGEWRGAADGCRPRTTLLGGEYLPLHVQWTPEINTQLEQATKSFLTLETQINQQKQKIYTTKLFLWFLADFGGKKGIRKILEKNLNLNLKGYKIIFSDYNWQEQLHNFV